MPEYHPPYTLTSDIVSLVAAIAEQAGRLWQTLLLSHWQPVFAWLPVESLIHQQQAAYCQALNDSTAATDCAPFIQFMLKCIHQALQAITPQDTRQVTPQVESLLQVLSGEMTREAMQAALGLADRENFRKSYLLPALEAGLVEMTLPDKPNSRNQRYRLTPLGLLQRAGLLGRGMPEERGS